MQNNVPIVKRGINSQLPSVSPYLLNNRLTIDTMPVGAISPQFIYPSGLTNRLDITSIFTPPAKAAEAPQGTLTYDMNGNPIAFSARTMRDSEAKYINTASTLIYNKGDTVYNYHRAKEDGHKANRIIITEGVMDTIAFARADIPYVVSTLGTACTQKQLEIIATISRHLVFCYDGDKAGQNATMKAVELALNMGYEPSVIKNETGLDPDEIISNGKPKDLQNFAFICMLSFDVFVKKMLIEKLIDLEKAKQEANDKVTKKETKKEARKEAK